MTIAKIWATARSPKVKSESKLLMTHPSPTVQCTTVTVLGDIIQCATIIQRCSLLLLYYAFASSGKVLFIFFWFAGKEFFYDWLIKLRDVLLLAAASLCTCVIGLINLTLYHLRVKDHPCLLTPSSSPHCG